MLALFSNYIRHESKLIVVFGVAKEDIKILWPSSRVLRVNLPRGHTKILVGIIHMNPGFVHRTFSTTRL